MKDEKVTDPLKYAILEECMDWINLKSPGCLPLGMIARPKSVASVSEKMISVPPENFLFIQCLGGRLGHECKTDVE